MNSRREALDLIAVDLLQFLQDLGIRSVDNSNATDGLDEWIDMVVDYVIGSVDQ